MTLVEHAERELRLCGQYEEDPEFSESLIRAIREYSSYGHSGGSHFAAVHMLTELLNFRPLSPITDSPEEWVDVAEMSGYVLWQNKRRPDAFSKDGGKTYYTLEERDRLGSMELTPFHTSVHVEV